MQCGLGIGIFRVDNHKTRCGSIGEVDEDIVVGQWSDIIEVMVDRLQRVTSRINIVSRTQILSIGAQYLLTLESGNTLTDQHNVIGVGSYQWGALCLCYYVWNSGERFCVGIEPCCKDHNQARDDNADSGRHRQTKDARCNDSSRSLRW